MNYPYNRRSYHSKNVISLTIKCINLHYHFCLTQLHEANFLKLHPFGEHHIYISIPVDGIARHTVVNKCILHINSQTRATWTEKYWGKDSLGPGRHAREEALLESSCYKARGPSKHPAWLCDREIKSWLHISSWRCAVEGGGRRWKEDYLPYSQTTVELYHSAGRPFQRIWLLISNTG